MADAIDIKLGRWAMERLEAQARLHPIAPHLSPLLPLKPESELDRRWYVVQTEPQREIDVAKRVHDLCMDTYHPREPRSVRVNGRTRRLRTRPILMGYLFVGFD